MTTTQFVLYGSDGCHLCELAFEICQQFINTAALTVIDIVDDETLVELYGVHIPVLENVQTHEKLFWPFNKQQVAAFI